jgi:hypothetical protein
MNIRRSINSPLAGGLLPDMGAGGTTQAQLSAAVREFHGHVGTSLLALGGDALGDVFRRSDGGIPHPHDHQACQIASKAAPLLECSPRPTGWGLSTPPATASCR